MNKERIIVLLKNTTNPDASLREPAESNLNAIHKIIGFTPALLEIALDDKLTLDVRQSAVIYLKNNVMKFWDPQNVMNENGQIDPNQFIIHENDKKLISDSIVDSLVRCGHENLLVQLSSIVNIIIKADFPHRWPNVVEKIHLFLAQTNDPTAWYGALLTFYQLAKIYEYKNSNDRKPFIEALGILMPAACQRLTQLLQSDPNGEQSCRLQKQILKTFHATLQYSLPLAILTREIFGQWMTLIIEIAKRDIPEGVDRDLDPEDKPELIWWKCRKWALHILARIFERYGSPNNVNKDYKSFAEWYINTFSFAVIQTIIKILEQYATGHYVSPRVLQQALNYLNTAVLHSITWKMLKNDMLVVIERIVFPLMCHSDEDTELWQTDPREYIRMKYDFFEEYISPVSASTNLLHSLCKKRKHMLQETMNLVVNVFNNPQADAKAKDGALHMIGSISGVLLKKAGYKEKLEQLLVTYVFPLFAHPQGFLRSRACWVLHNFSGIEFKNNDNIVLATQSVLQCLLADGDLPVKVEAALALQSLLSSQKQAVDVTRPNVKVLTLQLVEIIRSTENEDVMDVLQKIVYEFPDDLYPIAVDTTMHLAQTFHQIIKSGEGEDEEKIASAMAILNTIDTIITLLDQQREVVAKLEPIAINIITSIFDNSLSELYEEAIALLTTITSDAVSPEVWRVFQSLFFVFKRDGCDYFTDMMSPLHNYITVDPNTFISSRDNIGAIFEMCKTIMNDPSAIPYGNEEIESYAAKLLEVVILQFRNQIDDCIPSFIELAINRLRREITLSELRTLLLQIVIAVFYYNHELLFNIFEKLEQQSNQPRFTLFDSFVKQWIKDVDELMGVHDRKMSMLGFCTLIMLPAEKRPPVITEIAGKIIPSIMSLCERLKIGYKKKATQDSDSETDDEDDDDESDNEADVLDDDQDHVGSHINDDDDEFEDIADGAEVSDTDDYDDFDSDDDCEPTSLESFETLIDTDKGFVDEFIIFKQVLESVRQNDPNWYATLLRPLDANQQKKLMELAQYTIERNKTS